MLTWKLLGHLLAEVLLPLEHDSQPARTHLLVRPQRKWLTGIAMHRLEHEPVHM